MAKAVVINSEGLDEVEGHLILRLPSRRAGDLWVSCVTCDRVLHRATTDAAAIVADHIAGRLEDAAPGTPQLLVPEGS